MAALTVEFPQTVWTVEFGGDEIVVAPVTMAPGAPGGGGAVDSVNGQTGVVVLDASDVGALDASSGYNTANGWLKLDGSGTAPDSTIPASIARDTEVTSAVSAHAAATDPHGDRAYAAGLVDDLSGVTNAATARTNLGLGNVDNTSDANKPVSTAQQTALDGKAAASHSHSGADITSGTVSTARLGTGAANATTFLRGDQTWAAAGGVQDSVPYVSGNYYQLGPPPASSNTAGSNAAGRLGAHPIYLPAGSYQSVGVWIDSAAVSTWRFGVYPNDPTTMTPCGQALLKDMGTISTNSTGLVSASSTFTIPTSGVYWLAVLCDAYTAAPSVRGLASASAAGILPFRGVTAEGFTSNPPYVSPFLWSGGVTTGAMPATFPATFGTNVYRAQNYIPYLIARAS